MEAEQAADVAAFAAVGGSSRSVAAELALELSITERRAGAEVALAQALTTRLPETFAAFRRGEIDGFKARMVFEPTNALSDEMARQVDAIVATRLAGKNPSSLRAAVNRVVQKVDAEGYERRSRARRRERSVCLIHQDETMATLLCELPVEQASAIYTSLDQHARQLRRHGDERTLEQLRADTLVDRLLNRSPGNSGIAPVIYVYIDLLTLAGLNENPAELAGNGTIPAWLGRDSQATPARCGAASSPSLIPARSSASGAPATGHPRPSPISFRPAIACASTPDTTGPPNTATSTTPTTSRKAATPPKTTSPRAARTTTTSKTSPGGPTPQNPAAKAPSPHRPDGPTPPNPRHYTKAGHESGEGQARLQAAQRLAQRSMRVNQ
jgi:hypothetical protein